MISIPRHTFGPTTVAKLSSADELRQVLDGPLPQSETVIIKPNWVSKEPGDFTDAATLRTLLQALDARVIITESYCLPRSLNLLSRGLEFAAGGKQVNWEWLLKGEGWKWLIENSDWEWFRSGEHWNHLIREDRAFLEESGFADLFDEFGVTYINVTEEVWSGRIAEPAEVKRIVESKYKPVENEKLYAMVPAKLFALRSSTFISYARLKMYASYTLKNLFGMIPDPLRAYWHGHANRSIAQSILDINKTYHALFQMFGICEAIFTLPVIHPEGEHEGIYSGKYTLCEGSGFVAFGSNLAALDALLLDLTDPSLRQIADFNRAPIARAEAELGLAVDREVFAEARSKVGAWMSPS